MAKTSKETSAGHSIAHEIMASVVIIINNMPD